jgi:hypothetical protein
MDPPELYLPTPSEDEVGAGTSNDPSSQEPSIVKTPAKEQHDSSSKKTDAWWKYSITSSEIEESDATTVDENTQQDAEVVQDTGADFNNEGLLLPSSEFDIDSEEEISEANTLLPSQQNLQLVTLPALPTPVTASHALKVIASCIYPNEHEPIVKPSSLSPRQKEPFSFSSLLKLIFNCIMDIFNDDPAIIEYTPEQIRRKINTVRVEAQIIEYEAEMPSSPGSIPSPKRIVSVTALLYVDELDQRRAVPITAKPKRVRDLIRDDGSYDLVEDLYKKEIKGALKKLGKMPGV